MKIEYPYVTFDDRNFHFIDNYGVVVTPKNLITDPLRHTPISVEKEYEILEIAGYAKLTSVSGEFCYVRVNNGEVFAPPKEDLFANNTQPLKAETGSKAVWDKEAIETSLGGTLQENVHQIKQPTTTRLVQQETRLDKKLNRDFKTTDIIKADVITISKAVAAFKNKHPDFHIEYSGKYVFIVNKETRKTLTMEPASVTAAEQLIQMFICLNSLAF